MGLIGNIYLIIFLPLIASLLCQILPKKSSFYLAFAVCVSLLFLLLRIFPEILFYQKISNDFELSILSVALEFKLDLLAYVFLLLLIFIKIITLIFSQNQIKNSLNENAQKNFYAVFLLHLFALSGIFTSNNIFNLFFFFEIYAFAFFALSSIASEVKLLKISFNYFSINVVSSLLIIFCFFVIYLTFAEVNFDKISFALSLAPQEQNTFIATIFFLLFTAIFIKFFPLNLYFQKLKSPNLIAGFLVIDTLFIKSLIGAFLIIKFGYFLLGDKLFFAQLHFDKILILFGAVLISYSCLRLYKQKHLKLIAAYFALSNLGFIFIEIALKNVAALRALFFHLLAFSLLNFFIFLFAYFLQNKTKASAIFKIHLLKNSQYLLLPFYVSLFFIAGLPLSFAFFANWHLINAAFDSSLVILIFILLIMANFTQILIVINIALEVFFKKEKGAEKISFYKNLPFIFSLYLLIITMFFALLFSDFINKFSLQFSSYLLT